MFEWGNPEVILGQKSACRSFTEISSDKRGSYSFIEQLILFEFKASQTASRLIRQRTACMPQRSKRTVESVARMRSSPDALGVFGSVQRSAGRPVFMLKRLFPSYP